MAHGWGTPSLQGVTTDKSERTPQVWIPILITLSISLFEELWVCRQETSLCPSVSAETWEHWLPNFKVMTVTWRTADTPRWLGPTPEFQMCHVWSRDWDSASLRSVRVRLILMLLILCWTTLGEPLPYGVIISLGPLQWISQSEREI